MYDPRPKVVHRDEALRVIRRELEHLNNAFLASLLEVVACARDLSEYWDEMKVIGREPGEGTNG